MANQPAHRNKLAVERGGVPRPVYGARRQRAREVHDLVIAATADVSTQVDPRHADWAYDLRRGRLNIYGGLLRFIDLLHSRGISKAWALKIPAWITAYIEEVYEDTAPAAVVDPKRIAKQRRAA